jgi:hypothetical protein
MSNEPTVKCPKCNTEIKLTESLAAPMVEAARAEMQGRVDDANRAATAARSAAAAKTATLEKEIAERVEAAKEQAEAEAKASVDGDLRRLNAKVAYAQAAQEQAETAAKEAVAAEVQQLNAKLAEAQTAQAEALRKERGLADRERELDLTVERRVTDAISTARGAAYKEAEDSARLKRMELESTIASMQVKLAEAQQKAEQGSQQLQGEVQEIDLETQLRAQFPFDTIAEVGKGVTGADITQTVVAPSGAVCGVILWESKRTKSFSAGWLAKLREDGRAAKADVLLLVTQAMPKDVEGFDCVETVWVTQPRFALPLAIIMRETLLRVHATKQAQEGTQSKAEEVYSYVTGPQFRHRVELLVEAFTTMQEDLVAEQKAVQRAWSKRSTQLERMLTGTAGLFGDMQGIAGRALPSPVGLELPA